METTTAANTTNIIAQALRAGDLIVAGIAGCGDGAAVLTITREGHNVWLSTDRHRGHLIPGDTPLVIDTRWGGR